MPGEKAPRRKDVVHSQSSVESAEKKFTKLAGLEGSGYEVKVVRSSDGRDARSDAKVGNLRKK